MRVFDRKAAPVRVLLLLLGFVLSWGWGWGQPQIDMISRGGVEIWPNGGGVSGATPLRVCPGDVIELIGTGFTNGSPTGTNTTCDCITQLCAVSTNQTAMVNSSSVLTQPGGLILCWSDLRVRIKLPTNFPSSGQFNVFIRLGNGNNAPTSNTVSLLIHPNPSVAYSSSTYCALSELPAPSTNANPSSPIFFSTSNYSNPGTAFTNTGSISSLNAPLIGVSSYTFQISASNQCGVGLANPISITVNAPAATTITKTPQGQGNCAAFGNPSFWSLTASPSSVTGNYYCPSYSAANAQGQLPNNSFLTQGQQPGTYDVTFVPLAGCFAPSTTTIDVMPNPSNRFHYADSNFCTSDPGTFFPYLPIPGGVVTVIQSSPIGGGVTSLSLDPVTGAISPALSSPGIYRVSWSKPGLVCGNNQEQTIQISNPPNADFGIPSNSGEICVGSTLGPTIQCSSVSPNGTITTTLRPGLCSAGGLIQIGQFLPTDFGQHQFTQTITNQYGCTSDSTKIYTFFDDSQQYRYSQSVYCKSEGGVSPFPLEPGGTFSVASSIPPNAQLSLDPSTGLINTVLSDTGIYMLRWIKPGRTCRDTILCDSIFRIIGEPEATFSYANANLICERDGARRINVLNPTHPTWADNFVMVAANLNDIAIDADSGYVDIGRNAVAGTYYIIRQLPHAALPTCQGRDTVEVEVTAKDSALIYFPYPGYCLNESNPFPLHGLGAQNSGTFIGLSQGLIVDSDSGWVDLANSQPGPHAIRFVTGGLCTDTSETNLVLRESPDAFFSLNGGTFCPGQIPIQFDSAGLPENSPFYGDFLFYDGNGNTTSIFYVDTIANPAIIRLSPSQSPLPGQYSISYELRYSASCVDIHRARFEILPYDSTTQIILQHLNAPNRHCEGDAFEFSATPGKSGSWLFGSGLLIDSLAVDPLTGRQLGGRLSATNVPAGPGQSFNIRFSSYGECGEYIDSTIFVYPDDDPTFDYISQVLGFGRYCADEIFRGPATTIPAGGHFEVNPDPALTDPWMTVSDSGGLNIIQSILDQYDSSGTTIPSYKLNIRYITNEVCVDTIEKTMVVFPRVIAPNLEVGPPNHEICEGDFLQLDVETPNFYKIYHDRPDPSFPGIYNRIDSVARQAFTTTATQNQDRFVFRYYNEAGCYAEQQIDMVVHPIPTMGPLNELYVGSYGEVPVLGLYSSIDSTEFLWDVALSNIYLKDRGLIGSEPEGDFLINADLENKVIAGEAAFNFVPLANGCYGDTISTSVRILPVDDKLFIPGIITPNNDGFNDDWVIQWKDATVLAGHTLFLYNPNGALVKQLPLNQSVNTWDPGNAPDGIYRWMVVDDKDNLWRKGGLAIRRKPSPQSNPE